MLAHTSLPESAVISVDGVSVIQDNPTPRTPAGRAHSRLVLSDSTSCLLSHRHTDASATSLSFDGWVSMITRFIRFTGSHVSSSGSEGFEKGSQTTERSTLVIPL